MEIIEIIGKLVGIIFVLSVFFKAWGEGHKVWAIFSFILFFPAFLYCIINWYEMKVYLLSFLGSIGGLFIITFILGYFSII